MRLWRRSDERLADAAARGDMDALAAVYDRHGAVAYGLAHRIVGNSQGAEAAVADAFAKLAQPDSGSARRGTTVCAWILALVQHRAVEILRSTGGVPHDGAGTAAGAAGAHRGQDRRRGCALGTLSDEQGELLLAAYYDGSTVSDLAARADRSPGDVKHALYVALSRLRRELAQGAGTAERRAPGGSRSRRPRRFVPWHVAWRDRHERAARPAVGEGDFDRVDAPGEMERL